MKVKSIYISEELEKLIKEESKVLMRKETDTIRFILTNYFRKKEEK